MKTEEEEEETLKYTQRAIHYLRALKRNGIEPVQCCVYIYLYIDLSL